MCSHPRANAYAHPHREPLRLLYSYLHSRIHTYFTLTRTHVHPHEHPCDHGDPCRSRASHAICPPETRPLGQSGRLPDRCPTVSGVGPSSRANARAFNDRVAVAGRGLLGALWQRDGPPEDLDRRARGLGGEARACGRCGVERVARGLYLRGGDWLSWEGLSPAGDVSQQPETWEAG